MRSLLAASVLVAALAAPAPAAVRIGEGPLHALTASGGAAWAVVESGRRGPAFTLVRSAGAGAGVVRRFGQRNAVFPDVGASATGRVFVSWGRPVSGGEAYELASGSGAARVLGISGTGPARLDFSSPGEEPQIVYPDREGDVARQGEALTFDAPARRHHPLDAEAGLVLDVGQTREFTELRVLGPGAPEAAVDVMGGIPSISGAMALGSGRVYVAWLHGGRAKLAVAQRAPDADWSTLELPGPGRGGGTASVVLSNGRPLVAYSQRGDIYVWRQGRRARRLTRGNARDADPRAAVDPRTGAVFVAWTRRTRGEDTLDAVLERLPTRTRAE